MTTEASDIKTIARQLRARREHLGLSIEQVARALSMSRVNYNRKELGDVIVTGPELATLSRLFNVPVAYFFDQMTEEGADQDEAMRYYNGLPPSLKTAARHQLKALFDAQDQEAKELEPTTHGKRAE